LRRRAGTRFSDCERTTQGDALRKGRVSSYVHVPHTSRNRRSIGKWITWRITECDDDIERLPGRQCEKRRGSSHHPRQPLWDSDPASELRDGSGLSPGPPESPPRKRRAIPLVRVGGQARREGEETTSPGDDQCALWAYTSQREERPHTRLALAFATLHIALRLCTPSASGAVPEGVHHLCCRHTLRGAKRGPTRSTRSVAPRSAPSQRFPVHAARVATVWVAVEGKARGSRCGRRATCISRDSQRAREKMSTLQKPH